MSTDAEVTKDLLKTLENGVEGFTKGADRLADSNRPDLADPFRSFATQRETFASELRSIAAQYGDDIDESSTVAGALHRGWMAVKDTFAGSDPDGVLDAAEQGEDHAVEVYGDALERDISPHYREVIQRQAAAVKQAHDDVRVLRDSVS